MLTIYDRLRESHERQRSFFRKLLRTAPGVARRDGFTALRKELAAHAAAEERFLYAVILMQDAGLKSSRHALSEHHDIDEIIEDMQKLDPAGEAWMTKAHELSHKVHHHLREEEKKFFQVSGKLLSQTAKVKLGRDYEKDYQRMLKVLP
jgi:hypothetical protein